MPSTRIDPHSTPPSSHVPEGPATSTGLPDLDQLYGPSAVACPSAVVVPSPPAYHISHGFPWRTNGPEIPLESQEPVAPTPRMGSMPVRLKVSPSVDVARPIRV